MRPDFSIRVAVEARLSPSEDPTKVLSAAKALLGDASATEEVDTRSVRVRTDDPRSLDRVRDQLRDRRVRGAARKRLVAGRNGNQMSLMFNRQAASVGVVALCDDDSESPLGPLRLTIESDAPDKLLAWLADTQPP